MKRRRAIKRRRKTASKVAALRAAYRKMREKYKDEDFEKKRLNCYNCKCGHVTKTISIDHGVTPGLLRCKKCDEFAPSTFFNDIAPDQDPTVEWYRPTFNQMQSMISMQNYKSIREHVMNGGLLYRPAGPEAKKVLKKIEQKLQDHD